MATNGMTKITVKGVDYPLYFGRMAIEEVARRTEISVSPNHYKLFFDMVYGGMCNYTLTLDVPVPFPKISEVNTIIEDFYDEPDCKEQQEAVDKVFRECKWGKEYISKVNDLKKKWEKDVKRNKTQANTGSD